MWYNPFAWIASYYTNRDLGKICKRYGGQLSDKQQAWLNAIYSDADFSEIINKNIDIFKLPAALNVSEKFD